MWFDFAIEPAENCPAKEVNGSTRNIYYQIRTTEEHPDQRINYLVC